MLEPDLSEFPVIITRRLVLREPVARDAPALFAMRSDERVMQHIGRPRATTLGDAEELIATIARMRAENNGIGWAITLKGSDTLIGTIGFHRIVKEHYRAEIGYMLHPDHWRRKIMSEALQAVIQYGFTTLHLHSIEAVTDPINLASNRSLQRAGFVQEGLFKENYHWNGKFHDSAVWSLLAS